MSDQNQALRDDIAFLRVLAESGRDKPMPGGAILFAVGLIYGAASLLVWRLALRDPSDWLSINTTWMGAGVICLAVVSVLLRRIPKQATTLQAASGIAWSAAGLMSLFISLSLGVIGWRMQSLVPVYGMPSIILAVYGGVWFIGGTLLRQRWMQLCALASFATTLIAAWVATQPAVFLVFGLALLALLAAPGAVLMRQGRTAD